MRNKEQLLKNVWNESPMAVEFVYVNVMFHVDKGICGWTSRTILIRRVGEEYTIGTVDTSLSAMVYRK